MDEFIGIIKLFAGDFAPVNWLFCWGQILSVSQYQALFAVIGTKYGGNGTTTFGLPDLRGRVPISTGQGLGLSNYPLGEKGGEENIYLIQSQLPMHKHPVFGLTATVTVNSGSDGTTNSPAGNYWGVPSNIANNTVKAYTPNKAAMMASDAVTVQVNGDTGVVGDNFPIDVRQPYLALNYIICVEGMFPQRQ